MGDPIACPECGTRGRKVEPVTLESLLIEDARADLNGSSDFRFCKTELCEVVYYREGGAERFVSSDVRVPVFQKSADPSRIVCYCFEHRVADIEYDVARTGTSVVPEAITEKCRQGLDHCEELNPQGACCLGNVRQVVKAAMAQTSSSEIAAPAASRAASDRCAVESATGALPAEDCCSPAANVLSKAVPARRQRRAGLWSASGAVVAAALSSACCWLPLMLIAMGASAAGVGGFFEAYRIYFLGGAALLLAAGFYFVYLRQPTCAPGEVCEAPSPKFMRLNRIMIWVATVFVLALAAFPNYVGALLGGADDPPPAATASLSSRTYTIEGMTCQGCAGPVKKALMGLDGVASAEVSYPEKLVRLYVTEQVAVTDAEVIAAVETLGYRARPASAPANVQQATFSVEGMTCGSCNVAVKVAAEKVEGVTEAAASHADKRAWVSFDPTRTTPETIARALTEAGYRATPEAGPVSD